MGRAERRPERALSLLGQHRGRLALAAAAGLAAVWLEPPGWSLAARAAASWDLGAFIYLALTWSHGLALEPAKLPGWARSEDGRPWVMSAVVSVAVLSSLGAIGLLLGEGLGAGRLLLGGLTLLSGWLVLHTVFAAHYARLYYDPDLAGFRGLRFPEHCAEPAFLDFAYFAFVVGMTFQVSDVVTTNRPTRTVVLCHAFLAFVFNTVLVALTLGVAASVLLGAR